MLSEINIIGNFNIHMIVNDFLMAIFFLLVGLEIKHELLYGHLSSIKKASFPIISAIGGVLVPAIIFLIFNHNSEFSIGVGIPISTDIAFAVGIFMILKSKLNPSLKIFLLSLAVVDDLISILAIGVLYSSNIQYFYIIPAITCIGLLISFSKVFKINKVLPYLLVGLLLWFCIYFSGIHATISGIFVAMTIPSKKLNTDAHSMLETLEHKLSPICNLLILPLFALVNTSINLNNSISFASVDKLVCGVVLGLVVGKPLGIMLISFVATKLHLTEKPEGSSWSELFCVSLLAGIGFTMSIFISEIAFEIYPDLVNVSKISILGASLLSMLFAFIFTNIHYKLKTKSIPTHSLSEKKAV